MPVCSGGKRTSENLCPPPTPELSATVTPTCRDLDAALQDKTEAHHADKAAQLAAQYVRTHEAARLLGISPRTLEKYRCHGSGPTFRKLGGRVVYAVADLEAWADRAVCSSTSDPRYAEARAAGHANR